MKYIFLFFINNKRFSFRYIRPLQSFRLLDCQILKPEPESLPHSPSSPLGLFRCFAGNTNPAGGRFVPDNPGLE